MSQLLRLLGFHFPDGVPLSLLPVVIAIGRDLADGDAHLSQEARAELGEAIEAAKRGDL